MSYAGYFSTTNLIPDKKTTLEEALHRVPALETLEVIGKLCKNVVVQPNEGKFRRIRLSNAKIKAAVVDVDGGLDTLLAMGWERAAPSGGEPPAAGEEQEEALEIGKGKLTMKQVRTVEEAKDRLKKELRAASVSRSSSQRSLKEAETDATKAALRAQLEADRRERAAMAPVTKGSVAQSLPGQGGISTCKDAGINQGGCC